MQRASNPVTVGEESQSTSSADLGGQRYRLLPPVQSAVRTGRLPQAVIGFSSVAGWFGNTGQTDYSAANDLLCKLVSALCSAHPEIKGVCLDWGPWAEVGHGQPGAYPGPDEDGRGGDAPPAAAAPLVRAELLAGRIAKCF